jgi:hypothetical protein
VITELNVLSNVLLTSANLLGDESLRQDHFRLERNIKFFLSKPKAQIKFARSLKSFFDAVKDGVNSGTFVCPKEVYLLWGRITKRSKLPLFLRSLTQRIFNGKTGERLTEFSLIAVDMCLSFLRLTKRLTIKSPSLHAYLKRVALEKFIEEQKPRPAYNPQVCSDIKAIWATLFELHPFRAGVASPGPGSVSGVDKDTYSPEYTVLNWSHESLEAPFMSSIVDVAYQGFFGPEHSPWRPGGIGFVRKGFPDLPGDQFTQVPFSIQRRMELLTVPKDLTSERAMGKVHISNVLEEKILFASADNNVADNGLRGNMNVRAQADSGAVLLRDDAAEAATIDWSTGSANITYRLLDLTAPRVLLDPYKEVRITEAIDWDGNIHPVTCCQLGCAMTVYWLTMFGLLLQILARIYHNRIEHPLMYEMFCLGLSRRIGKRNRQTSYRNTIRKCPWLSTKFRPLTKAEIVKAIEDTKNDPKSKQVGDDAIFDKVFASIYLSICRELHIKINYDKSSFEADHRVPESCGTFVVIDNNGKPHKLSVARAPVGINKNIALASAAQFTQRLNGSPLLVLYAHSFSSLFHSSFSIRESYHEDGIGTPFPGGRPPKFISQRCEVNETLVDDRTAYLAQRCARADSEQSDSKEPFGHYKSTLSERRESRVKYQVRRYEQVYETRPRPLSGSEEFNTDKPANRDFGLLRAKSVVCAKQTMVSHGESYDEVKTLTSDLVGMYMDQVEYVSLFEGKDCLLDRAIRQLLQ